MAGSSELYCEGTLVWLPDHCKVWLQAKLLSSYTPSEDGSHLELELVGGERQSLHIATHTQLPLLCNPDLLLGTSDLTTLSYLHEPAVLHNLHYRYTELQNMYTYCGIVLVAINPYQSMPLYGNEFIRVYSQHCVGGVEPHVYGVASETHRSMIRESRSQSIIISGESGAGKTVTAKYVIRYLASVGGVMGETLIEKRILSSNTIMEAIGNAKTTRNDNSSRFGKFIEIGFSKAHNITGANMHTYLLEKSRVVTHGAGERSYHVFYQLCAAREEVELADLKLKPARLFHYTSCGGQDTHISGVCDKDGFHSLSSSLLQLGVDNNQQWNLYRTLAGILHLGNVVIQADTQTHGSDSSSVSHDSDALKTAGTLLGVDSTHLCHWLTHRLITTAKETLTSPISCEKALTSRDSLSKHLYAALFSWVVQQINQSLSSSGKPVVNSIGVLDIYGFEVFDENSFEQFCINYANEKLQQQFNMHVFQLEQQEYVREGIKWSFIGYYDNQPCIDLIEGKLGILDLLDETCKMPGKSDELFIQKLYHHHLKEEKREGNERGRRDRQRPGGGGGGGGGGGEGSHFSKPRLSRTAFCVRHYACLVQYEREGFVDKNTDSLSLEHLNLLKSSENQFVADLFCDHVGNTVRQQRNVSRKAARMSVASQFRESLSQLMNKLNKTMPHYIRCIKPNDDKKPFLFDPVRVVEQLRACGVLETIRISAAGYPSRWSYSDFFARYRPLIPSGQLCRDDHAHMCQWVLQRYIKDREQYRFGKTKLFFRAGQVAYLEQLRAHRLHVASVLLQCHIRGWVQRHRYQRLKRAAVSLQAMIRGVLARRLTRAIRETHAATLIQTQYRMHRARLQYHHLRQATLLLQCLARGRRARRVATELRRDRAAVCIQAHVRGWLSRCAVVKRRLSIVRVQCCVRRWLAQRQLRTLRLEARSVTHLKTLNKGLELKIMELQHKLMDQVQQNQSVTARCSVLESRCRQLDNMSSLYRAQVEKMNKHVTELEEKVESGRGTEEELNRLREEHQQSLCSHKQDVSVYEKLVTGIKDQLAQAKKTISELTNETHSHTEWQRLVLEHTQLQEHHQDVLRNVSRLEEKLSRLQAESHAVTRTQNETSQRLITKQLKAESSPNLLDWIGVDPVHAPVTLKDQLPGKREPLLSVLRESVCDKENIASFLDLSKQQIRAHSKHDQDTRMKELVTENETLRSRINSLTRQLQDEPNQFSQACKRYELKIFHLEQQNKRMMAELEAMRSRMSGDGRKSVINMTLHEEITRVTHENMKLREELEFQTPQPKPHDITLLALSPRAQPSVQLTPVVVQSLHYKPSLGMVSWQLSDLPKLVSTLITGANIDELRRGSPCQTANVLFMCLRYADHCHDEKQTKQLLESVASSIQQLTQRYHDNVEVLAFWLSNTHRFLQNMKQFSAANSSELSTDQTCLTSFELSDYHQLINDCVIGLYQALVTQAEDQLLPIIVGGILEHEAIPGISTSNPIGQQRWWVSVGVASATEPVTVEKVESKLSYFLSVMRECYVEPEMIGQLFKQIFYMINAHLLNNLLLRKDLCHWSHGLQIRYNLNVLEEWVRTNSIHHTDEIISVVQPIVQASQLLQMNKQTQAHAHAICSTCTRLSPLQMQKLLTMYTPTDDMRVPVDVIRYVASVSAETSPAHLMADIDYKYPVSIPFSATDVNFADVSIPKQVGFLVKI